MRPAPLALLLLPLAACGGSETGDDDDVAGPTWYQDVAPVAAEHCMGCHREGGIAPFSMTEYAVAREHAPDMAYQTEHGYMPPWDAVDATDCEPRFGWRDDPRLTDDEIALFRDWSRAGAPAGEVEAIPDPPSTEMTGITHSVTTENPYVTSGDFDEFVCYVLDPGVTQLGYMTGMQLTPGNPKVVHHAVTSVMPPGAELDALIAEHGVDQPFDCSGSMGATRPGAYLLNVWTPGQMPMQTPSDLAIPILAGSHLVVQYHYHPGGITNDPDATRLDLRLSSTAPDHFYTIGAWGNAFQAPELLAGPNDPGGTPVFFIPANEANHSERMRFQVVTENNARFGLFGAYPHMHYLGIELKVKVERATPLPGEPTEECLVNIDRWSFDWQRTYQYDAPVDELPTVGNGDIIDIYCTYDNTIDNPFVARALDEAQLSDPIDVTLGEETLDEMCLGIFHIVFDAPANAAERPDLRFVPAPLAL